MARGRSETSIDHWVETLGQQIGIHLGKVIAEHLQRTLEKSVDLGAVARGMSTRPARRGRPSSEQASCSEPGCGHLALAKGLCRSHYYRARYQSRKSGTRRAAPVRRGRRSDKAGAAAGGSTPA